MKAETVGGWAVVVATFCMIVACLISCCGCEPQPMNQPSPIQKPPCDEEQCPYAAGVILDLPLGMWTPNYAGGSCMFASAQDVLKGHGMISNARWLRQNYSGAGSVERIAAAFDKAGIPYAITTSGDLGFLDWCSRNGHGAAIHYYQNHAVTFCGYRDGYAFLRNNNSPNKTIRVPKADFQRKWRGYGGCAITVVASPAAPKPHL